jgi:hypothetical protein
MLALRMPGTHKLWATAFFLLAGVLLAAGGSGRMTGGHWEIAGDFSEACSCAVPCTCNFGEGPAPHHFCWTMFCLDIHKGHYGSISLNGLHLAAAHGDKAVVWYIDHRATPAQFTALKEVASQLRYHTDLPAFFESARITQEVTRSGTAVEISGQGGFRARFLHGRNPKKPIVVLNNTAWNVPRVIKGRTEYLRYSDKHGNGFDFRNTNSNEGQFDWSDHSGRE